MHTSVNQPIVIAGDMGKRAERAAFISLLIGLALQMIGIWGIYELENEPFGLALQAASIACLLIVSAIHVFGHDRDSADWLRLDSHGLTVVHRGESRSWHWVDIVTIERRGLLSATAPRYGRSIALALEHDGRQPGPGRPNTVIIGDDYLTPIGEIADKLEAFRQGADGRVARSDSASGSPAVQPDIFHRRDEPGNSASPNKTRRERVVMWLWVWAGVIACMTYGSAGSLLGWPEHGTPLTDFGNFRVFAFLAAMVGLRWPLKAASRGEFLLLSSDGLHLRWGDERRHWRWRDLSDFQTRDGRSGDDGRSDAALAYMVKGEELTMEGSEEIFTAYVIEDKYDAPLAEIARRIEVWRSLSREDGVETAKTGGLESASRAMEIRGSSQGEMGMMAPIGLAGTASLLLATFSLLAMVPIGIGLLGNIPGWLTITLMLVGFPLVVLFFIVGVGQILPSEYVLRFEEDGFAVKRLGLWQRWKWHELSACELRTARLRGGRRFTNLAIFNVPRSDWVSRFWLWCYQIDSGRPSVPIEPVYEAPLDMIVEKISAHRGKALRRRDA